MKLNYRYKSLRVAILGLFSIAMLIYMSVIADAEQNNGKLAVSELDLQKVRNLFLLNGNEVPTFWGSPIVPTFYDATGKHDKLLAKAEIFALYYAQTARLKTINDDGIDENPTLAFVIADHKIEDSHLAEPLKNILSAKWEGSLISEVSNGIVMQYRVNGELDGSNCSLFIGVIKKTNPSYYLVEAAAIIANSSMSDDDILLCFKNKTVLAFGLAPSTFEIDRRLNQLTLDNLFFGVYPTLLDAVSLCREHDFNNTISCVANTLSGVSRSLLRGLSENRN